MLKQIIGPSPAVFIIKKIRSSLLCRGGSDMAIKVDQPNKKFVKFAEKLLIMTNIQLNELLRNSMKKKIKQK
jgi:hypothetical protein